MADAWNLYNTLSTALSAAISGIEGNLAASGAGTATAPQENDQLPEIAAEVEALKHCNAAAEILFGPDGSNPILARLNALD
jgi:hypothetical protein